MRASQVIAFLFSLRQLGVHVASACQSDLRRSISVHPTRDVTTVSSLAVAKTNSRKLVDDMIASRRAGLTEWDELRNTVDVNGYVNAQLSGAQALIY